MLGKIKKSLKDKTIDKLDRKYQRNYWDVLGRATCYYMRLDEMTSICPYNQV